MYYTHYQDISYYILCNLFYVLLTGLGTRKPANRFQKLRKKDMTMAAIWWPGVRATTIIPYNVKYIKHIKMKK